jgi:hypothetical protein
MERSRIDREAQRLADIEQVTLADEFHKRSRPHAIGEWTEFDRRDGSLRHRHLKSPDCR